MKQPKTWVDYLAITVIVAFVLVGIAALLGAVAVCLAMNSYGSNK